MRAGRKNAIRAYGLRVLLSNHPVVRKLKREHCPSEHGVKTWDSTWLLIDCLSRQCLKRGARVMDAGCGWGLAGIYCAKKYDSAVTCVDADPEVFPFLRVHAEINGVRPSILNKGIGGLKEEHLRGIDTLVGAEICYSDKMGYLLKRLINRALRAGVRRICIADPGRPDFNALGEYCARKHKGQVLDREIAKPKKCRGYVLMICKDAS